VHPVPAPRLAALVALALDCVEREYPNQIALGLRGDADLAPPRELTPAFYGCYDWHSAVHGHWLLARAVRLAPDAPWAPRARAVLDRHLCAERMAREHRHALARPTFERPYGLAWLLCLHGELAAWDDADAPRWAAATLELAELAAGRLRDWLMRLTHPVRSGVHSQTAFAMGLALDWAHAVRDEPSELILAGRALFFHLGDRDHALHLEPSGEDFLSPSLGAADLMRRVLPPEPFAAWLALASPGLGRGGLGGGAELVPVAPSDRSDGRLAHLDGLNLSRAWMLTAIARHLPSGDARRTPLERCAAEHVAAGLAAVRPGEYMGAHWLGSFALYLLSEVGLPDGVSA
jgi:hypothetical protein